MKLQNFILEGGFSGTTLFGLGRHWDLHSFAEARSILFDPRARTLAVEWAVPSMPNPWGSPGNRACGCRLVFEGVLALQMTDREAEASPEADAILTEVSRVVPGEAAYSWIEKGAEPERFRLRFRFESGRTLEVESESVRLEPLDGFAQDSGAGARSDRETGP